MRIPKIAVAVLVALGLLFAAQAPAASPEAPARQLSSIAMPTNFAPGGGHAVGSGPDFAVAPNVAAPAEGPDPAHTIVALLIALSIAPWMAFRERDRINQALQLTDQLRRARPTHTTGRTVR